VHEVPPPALGQHTDEILTKVLNKTSEQVAALKAQGIV
jgi:crotonobetainyl-CoA:carnitine CoA-transferase CaiB-like acyl-CoA transferase